MNSKKDNNVKRFIILNFMVKNAVLLYKVRKNGWSLQVT